MSLQKELQFKMGDVITVYGDVDYDGFYRGELSGCRGLVPSNFLRPASAADAGAQRPLHARPGPSTSSLPPALMPDEALLTRAGGGSDAVLPPDAAYGHPPPVVSPTPMTTNVPGSTMAATPQLRRPQPPRGTDLPPSAPPSPACLLYTSDAADE